MAEASSCISSLANSFAANCADSSVAVARLQQLLIALLLLGSVDVANVSLALCESSRGLNAYLFIHHKQGRFLGGCWGGHMPQNFLRLLDDEGTSTLTPYSYTDIINTSDEGRLWAQMLGV